MKIQRLPLTVSGAVEIPSIMNEYGVTYHAVSCVNWPAAFPYAPDAAFAIAHTGKQLLLHYVVREASSRAAAAADNGRVWEDSCMECFISPDDKGYYNIECNCIGKLVFGFGPGRKDRIAAPGSVLKLIDRWTTLPQEPFDERVVEEWQAALLIPAECFYRHSIKSLDSLKAKGNFFKCGDLLSTVHYTSWSPVETPQPDFHRPEFFAPLEF